MKVLLFGSQGAVGTALETVCQRRGIECVSLRRADADVTVASAVIESVHTHRPDIVVNGAAIIGIKVCEDDPLNAFVLNALAAHTMAQVCEAANIVFIQPSSHAVFSGEKLGYYTEDDPVSPLNTYAITKHAAEQFALFGCRRSYVVRFPTLFGPRRNAALGFADKMLDRLVRGETVRVPTDKIDSPTYSLDAASALLDLVIARRPFGVYHIANAGAVSYFDFVRRMAELVHVRGEVHPALDREFDSGGRKPLRTAMLSVKLDPMRPWDMALTEHLRGTK